ncbi:hypothetical protein Trydic_g1519 [Trypoxylus dichotomus]
MTSSAGGPAASRSHSVGSVDNTLVPSADGESGDIVRVCRSGNISCVIVNAPVGVVGYPGVHCEARQMRKTTSVENGFVRGVKSHR